MSEGRQGRGSDARDEMREGTLNRGLGTIRYGTVQDGFDVGRAGSSQLQ